MIKEQNHIIFTFVLLALFALFSMFQGQDINVLNINTQGLYSR